jgi:hypothetical protein
MMDGWNGMDEPRDGSPDAVIWTGRLDDEREIDIDHVDDLDGSAEVEPVTEREFPLQEEIGPTESD